METTDIRTHNDLLLQLANLRYQKTIQQANLKVSIVENWNNLKHDPGVILGNGLNGAIRLGIDLLMGKPRNIKKILGTLLLEHVTTLLMNGGLTKVVTAISQYFFRKNKY